MAAYFTRETLKFLADLAKHNDRAWFQDNKERYEQHVKEPAERFAAEVGAKLGAEPKVMRIYRDVRFSKDKSPYKTNVGISFQRAGAKTGAYSGIYVHIAPKESFVGAGTWEPEPPVLAKIRAAIVDDPAGWKKARKVGLDEDEAALKTAPKGFDPEHPLIEDLRRKSFMASVKISDAEVASADLVKTVLAAEKKLRPLNAWLDAAVR